MVGVLARGLLVAQLAEQPEPLGDEERSPQVAEQG